MSDFNIRIEGLDELVANSRKATEAFGTLLFDTMVRATTMVQEEAKRVSPERFKNQTGNLRRSISRTVESYARGIVSVGEMYGAFVEFGTAPHVIEPTNGRALAFKIGGSLVIARRVNHPGSKAYPFMQPAFESQSPLIENEYGLVTEKIVNIMAGK